MATSWELHAISNQIPSIVASVSSCSIEHIGLHNITIWKCTHYQRACFWIKWTLDEPNLETHLSQS